MDAARTSPQTGADSGEFFRVVPDRDGDVCEHCKKGSLVTVAYTDASGEEIGVGVSWDADGDGPDNAAQHAQDLNSAYDLGRECARPLLEALECLLPGLILDLRYAGPDDDRDAMQSRIKTVTDAIAKAPVFSSNSGASR